MRVKPSKLPRCFRRAPCRPFAAPSRLADADSWTIAFRPISIQATPSSSNPSIDASDSTSGSLSADPSSETPDARFEILGSNSSLLSVALAASQTLYTRRGTLAGVSGSPENATSTLSLLSPLTRGVIGIPFLYQKISSPTPLNLLVAAKAPHTSFSVIHLDGRLDWTVAQRTGLIAWTGYSLIVKPRVNYSMSLAHWGNSLVTGRGLVALAASGNTYQITLKPDEQYVVHPSNVLAYTVNAHQPQPYRFKSSAFRFQIPSLRRWLPDSEFFRSVRANAVYKFMTDVLLRLRTWTRRTIWADRLFLEFQGPATILMQSRGSRIRDVLTSQDVNEIADAPAGIMQPASAGTGATTAVAGEAVKSTGKAEVTAGEEVKLADKGTVSGISRAAPQAHPPSSSPAPSISYASVGKDGKVEFAKA